MDTSYAPYHPLPPIFFIFKILTKNTYPPQNENLLNQNNEHYKSLRSRANEEGDAMARCFDESRKAYDAGDGAKAKELSNGGKEHQRRMNEINEEASRWIFEGENWSVFFILLAF